MYRLTDINVEYLEDIIFNDYNEMYVPKYNNTTKIIKGLKFLALKGCNDPQAIQDEIIIYTNNAEFCDADIQYLDKIGWVPNPEDSSFSFLTEL